MLDVMDPNRPPPVLPTARPPAGVGSVALEGSALTVLAAEVAADLRAWAIGFPFADPRRFRALALTTAVHLPGLGRAERALAARLNAWIFAFDDLVDGVPAGGPGHNGLRLADDALDRLTARCIAVTRDAGVDDGGIGGRESWADGEDVGGVTGALVGLVRTVAARPGFGPLAAHWRDTFARMLDGIVRERRLGAALAAGAPPPSPAALLETARYSIGAPHYLATCFILHSGSDDPGLPRRLPALAELALAAADVARLANDLRTWAKEEREGTFNSVRAVDAALVRDGPTLPAAERRARAVRVVEGLLADARGRVRALTAAPMPLPTPEAGIVRLVDFVPALYATADFHSFGSGTPPFPAPLAWGAAAAP